MQTGFMQRIDMNARKGVSWSLKVCLCGIIGGALRGVWGPGGGGGAGGGGGGGGWGGGVGGQGNTSVETV